jgi:hypothetical protein
MKIQKYNQFNEAQKMTSLHQPTDDEVKEAEEYLEKGISPDWDYKLGYFYIDVSGRYSVYYTLWKESLRSCNFISNLSTDFMTAVEKAKKAAGRIPVIIDRTGTKAGMFQAAKSEIFSGGKHRGKTIGEVFVEDSQYIAWLNKGDNYKGNDPIMKEKIKYYSDLYYETVTKQNREKSPSEHIGKVGDKITITANVYDSKKVANPFKNGEMQMQCKLIDETGNKYKTYNLDSIPKIGRDIKDGDTVKLTAKVKNHTEYLGIKFTEIYYIKVLDAWNVKELSEKFNL